jgi:predicted ATPase/DNA-binding CsgD family transcriptional regulator
LSLAHAGGAGGIGKTRLAIESMQYLMQSDFEHGVFYVPLAPIASAENIVTAIINTLGIHVGDERVPREELVNFLSQRNLLLVMDNFEHVLDGANIVTDILDEALHVKILATSRETLNLKIEHVWQVKGMRYPDEQEPADINQYDALNLFVERALQIQHDFSLSKEQVDIIQICQLVDGLPLAIELAAGWLKTLSCSDIINQIERSIDFLVTRNHDIPVRHRSIRAVFDHSWDLLSVDEQAVFPQLSVFRGGFTLEASEQVANANLMTLSGLVEKSMVRRNDAGRYDLHELLRQYGKEQLIDADELTSINEKYLDYFADFMAQHVPDLMGRRQVEGLEEINADIDNIAKAWQMASTNLATDKIEQMLECMNLIFEVIGHITFVNDMYTFAIQHIDTITDHNNGPKHRLKVFAIYTHYRQNQVNTYDHRLDIFSPLLRISEQHNDELAILMCLIMLISPDTAEDSADMKRLLGLAERFGTYYLAMPLDQICHNYTITKNENSQSTLNFMHRYLSVAQSINDIDGIASAYSHLAQHTRFWGKIDDALYYYDKAIQGFQQTHNIFMMTICKNLKIFMMLKMGHFSHVVRELSQGIDQLTQVGSFTHHVYIYMMMSKAEALLGNYERSQDYILQMKSLLPDERPRTVFHILEAQIMITIGLRDTNKLRQDITSALQVDTSVIAHRLLIDFLPLVAFLYYCDHNYRKAVTLLGFVFTHPLATTGWMEAWVLLSQLRNTLQQELGEEAYHMAWEEGRLFDLYKILAEIRVYIGLGTSTVTVAQPVIESLTERELDVLELLGEGHTNGQIATQLFVTIGTVKSHVYHICQKLDAKNRTQAVLEARKIGLL